MVDEINLHVLRRGESEELVLFEIRIGHSLSRLGVWGNKQ